ncbi:Rv1733c family protein [Mycobacterium angelicum]|uniref:Uncharacterized protein n=1 Tax=Mycobacterium angelicum TaxID=470074 RepID=A0A1W9ZB79_MYCAN|nr:hypothetical protein [Mycobacterium angelicum]MCV7196767.1 hypothetical protein [Mycobacterium angelicum]ORA10773.1 hypothetical protein BST12_26440 [Mycobacterium angelicum]
MSTPRPDRRRLRTGDGFEVLIALWVAAVVLIGIPLAVTVGSGVHDSRSRFYSDQAQNRRAVTAVITSDKATHRELGDPQTVTVAARWVADGAEHKGMVAAPRGVKAGDSVDIWVDENGYHVGLPHRTALDEAVAAALSTWLSVGAVAAVLLACGWAASERPRDSRLTLSSTGYRGYGH